MLVAFERSVDVSISTEKLHRVFLPLRISGFGLRRSLPLCCPAYLTSKLNFRFNGAALLQLPDGFWQQALSGVSAVIGAYQSTTPPSTAQAIHWLQSIQTTTHPNPNFLLLEMVVASD